MKDVETPDRNSASASHRDRTQELLHASKRWLYRGGRPHLLARGLNRIWATIHSTGIWPSRLATLKVRGRGTGRIISFPVVIADHDGDQYLVSMLGENTNWVRNVRAAEGRAVLRHGRREVVRLEEVEPGLRAPILRRYLSCAPGARPHISIDRDAPLEEFEQLAPDIPVFRIALDRSDPGVTAATERGRTGTPASRATFKPFARSPDTQMSVSDGQLGETRLRGNGHSWRGAGHDA